MLKLPAELTHDSAPGFLLSVRRYAREEAAIQVDASALTTFDSSAIAVLLECRRQALASSKQFSVQGVSGRLHQLAQLYGVAQLLQ